MKPAAKWLLLIEDDLDIRQYMRECIDDHLSNQVKIVEASDGVEAKEQLLYQNFDCIVTDLAMPRMNGVSFVQFVKSHNMHRQTPVIVVTGHDSPTLRQEYPDIQVLHKPFDALILVTLVQEQIDLGRLDDRNRTTMLLAVIESCESTLSSLLRYDLVVRQPMYLKRAQQDVSGDQLLLITLRSNDRYHILSLGLDDSLLGKLQKDHDNPHSLVLLKDFWSQTQENLMASLTQAQSAPPEIIQIDFVSGKGDLKLQSLTQLNGVGITEVTRHGCFHITVLNCPPGLISTAHAA